MTLPPESELWSAFIGGDGNAFPALYRMCYNKLYSYGVSCGMDPDHAADAIQDLFLRLYRDPSLVRDPATVLPMMLRSVKNYSLNLLKKTGRTSQMDESASYFDFSYTIDDVMMDSEDTQLTRERVEAMVDSLSPVRKEIVYLRFYLGFDYEEISTVMNISNQVARNLLHKAMLNLRKTDPSGLRAFIGLLLLSAVN